MPTGVYNDSNSDLCRLSHDLVMGRAHKGGGSVLALDKPQEPKFFYEGVKTYKHGKLRPGRISLSLTTKLVQGLFKQLLKVQDQQTTRWSLCCCSQALTLVCRSRGWGNQMRPCRKMMTAAWKEREEQPGGEAPGGKSTHKTHTEKAISRLLNSLTLSLIQETEAAGTQTKDCLPQCAHC